MKYDPDASFWHDDAKHPGVIVEVTYLQKKRRVAWLAEAYLLDSDANIRVVVGLDIECDKRVTQGIVDDVANPPSPYY